MDSDNSDSDTSSEDDFPMFNVIKPYLKKEKVDSKEYVHELFKHLSQDYSVIADKQVNIVFYNINDNNIFPFIKFLLVKQEDTLDFYRTKLSSQIKKDISNILFKDESEIRVKGYVAYKDQYYLFVYLLENGRPSLCTRNQPFWYCLLDEIVNHNKTCNFAIHRSVAEFLLSNPDFILLKNPDSMLIYESPSVVYSGSHFRQVELDGLFGPQKKSELSLFGPHYYFTNYEKAVEMGGWSSTKTEEYKFANLLTEPPNGRYIKGGINRYALFSMKQMVIHTLQPVYKMPAACNTLYIGIMQLNEHIFNDSPIWIAKKSNQFVPLSYHELDKNTLGDVWNKDYDNYFIS